MRIKNYLNEVFDNPYPLEWRKRGKDFEAYFTSDNGIEYVISFHVPFYIIKEFKDLGINKFSVYEILFYTKHDQKEHITKTGDAFKIFATVGKATVIFLNKKPKIEGLIFGSDVMESSRIKLYDRFADIIVNEINFDLIKKKKDAFYLTYFFVRKDLL